MDKDMLWTINESDPINFIPTCMLFMSNLHFKVQHIIMQP